MHRSKFPSDSPLAIACVALVTVVPVWGAWWIFAPGYYEGDFNRSIASGEMFGSLSTLFTGLGFVGVIYTIIQQRDELAHAKVLGEEARKTGEHERFENTFFQMLTLFAGIIDAFQYRPESRPTLDYKGRYALSSLGFQLRELLTDLEWTSWQFDHLGSTDRAAFFVTQYRVWYATHEPTIAHYFRVLYRLLRHIDHGTINNKRAYAKIVRAQLSAQELLLIFYNSFVPEGEKMREPIERYALLKHLPKTLLEMQSDRSLYHDSAYSDEEAFLRFERH